MCHLKITDWHTGYPHPNWQAIAMNFTTYGLRLVASGIQPISSALNVKFQIHSSTNSTTDRVKLLDDLNVTLRFITKL